MAVEKVMLVQLILVIAAIILSVFGIIYYFLGHKKFVNDDFKSYSTWMLYGVIVYTIHLFAHLAYVMNEIKWIAMDEDIVGLVLYIFLAIAGVFFLIGSYLYLKLSERLGFK